MLTPVSWAAAELRPGLAQAVRERGAREADCGSREDALVVAFQSSGGVASGEEIAALLRRHSEQPLSQLARWIVGQRVLHFDRFGQTLLPLFQFDLDTLSIRADVAAVLDGFAPSADADERVRWFVTPNRWLAGDLPIQRLPQDPALVTDAARADRFVSTVWS